MKTFSKILTAIFCMALASCSGENDNMQLSQTPIIPPDENPITYKYLALGDSYTIGQSVCETCRFPAQLKTQLESIIPNATINLSVIATTGWTTTNLINAINTQNPSNDNDLVTLLIGVNNQFQHKPFEIYEQEFPQLVTKAIALAKGNAQNVIVLSIPDYRYTPFGNGTQNPSQISIEIDQYNAFAQQYCLENNITYVNITDITRMGLENTALVASDGLHPSEVAYTQFVNRLLLKAESILLQ